MVRFHPVIALAAPPRVSPTTAAGKKTTNRTINMVDILLPHLYEEAELAFVTAVALLHYNP
jgi:hypothetical protein